MTVVSGMLLNELAEAARARINLVRKLVLLGEVENLQATNDHRGFTGIIVQLGILRGQEFIPPRSTSLRRFDCRAFFRELPASLM